MAGIVKTGASVTAVFVTSAAATGAATSADSLPTGTLYVNGTANAATVTVTNITTGRYKAAVTLPSLSAGDIVDIHVAATVGGVVAGGVVWSAVGDTRYISDSAAQTGDSFARIGAAGAGLTAVGDTSGTTTLLSRITALLQTKAEADTAHGLLATSADLATVAGYLDTEVAAILAAVDTEVAAILAGQSTLALLIAALDDLSAAQVQAAVAAALAAYPVPLIATIEAAIAAGSGATPATFWGYTGPGGRTLTQSMIAILSSMIEGSAITITRGDNVSVAITGLGSLADRTGLWFTVKARPATDTDAQAKIQATEDDGLLTLNGADADDSADGAITVDDEDAGDITITLSAAASAQLATGVSWRWDIQVAQPGPGTWTPRTGAFTVGEDVTRAVGP